MAKDTTFAFFGEFPADIQAKVTAELGPDCKLTGRGILPGRGKAWYEIIGSDGATALVSASFPERNCFGATLVVAEDEAVAQGYLGKGYRQTLLPPLGTDGHTTAPHAAEFLTWYGQL